MAEIGDRATDGAWVGLALNAQGRPEIATLPWRGRGFGLRPGGNAFKAAALFAEAPRATLELSLPAGEWTLVFTRHAWSGCILVRDAVSAGLHDLYAPLDQDAQTEIRVISTGPQLPVVIEIAAQRNPQARGGQAWLLEMRQPPSTYHPEGGKAVSQTCRLIEGRHGQFLALRTDTGVAEELASTGMWEQAEVELYSRLVRPGETVLDVGANIGHHTVALSKMAGDAGRVVAFEPQMQMFNLLNANIVLNRCRNVIPFRAAVGSDAGKLNMFPISYDSFTPFGSLGIQRDHFASGRGESVDVVRLDDVIPTLDLDESPLSFVKVDVQAHELFVFQGAKETLRRHLPTISFEVAPYWMQRAGYDWRDILALLRDIGYDFADAAGRPLQIPEWDGKSRGEWQFLAVHERYRSRLGR